MIGRAPTAGTGKGIQDSDYLLGLAGFDNCSFADVAALAGGGQAGATLLTPLASNGSTPALIRIKTCATNADSVQLPQAQAGNVAVVYNATAQTCSAYASPNVNKATAALDTINGAANNAAFTIPALAAGGTGVIFFCPANGIWAAMKSG